jgi:hypothetical protein
VGALRTNILIQGCTALFQYVTSGKEPVEQRRKYDLSSGVHKRRSMFRFVIFRCRSFERYKTVSLADDDDDDDDDDDNNNNNNNLNCVCSLNAHSSWKSPLIKSCHAADSPPFYPLF